MTHVEMYTDGSCKGNGRADGGRGGWAAILNCNGRTKELSGAEPNTTNNRMELLAVISGLEALTKECTIKVHYEFGIHAEWHYEVDSWLEAERVENERQEAG